MNWIKVGGYALIIIPTLFAGVVLTMYLLQDYMIFLGEGLPADYKYQFTLPYEELNFKAPAGHDLNALLFRSEDAKGLVYYHHGNAGNLQGWGSLAGNFVKNGYDVLFYDYRGYGKSTGKINREGQLHEDAAFIFREFMKDRSYKKLVLYGTSLGTGIASKLACEIQPDGLILETPYFSFVSLIKFHYFFLPARLLAKYKLRTHKYIKDLSIPILLFHGTADEVVPYECSVQLKALSDHISLVTIKGGIHNNLPDFRKYQEELSAYLSQL